MDKKELIIKTARILFHNYGYRKVSMDEIAKCSKITKKTIYAYFKDKDELFAYFIEEEITRIKQIADCIAKDEKDFFAKLDKMLYEMLKFRHEQKFLLNLSKDVSLNNSEKSKEFLRKVDNEIINCLQEKIDTAIVQEEIRKCDSRLVSNLLFSSYLDLICVYDEGNLDTSKLSYELVSLIRDGLRKRGD